MRLRYLGYAGQNLSTGRTTGRTLRLANLTPERAAEVTAANLADLRAILEWNAAHGIRFFRIGSSLVPFASHAEFALDWEERFADELEGIARFVRAEGARLAMHPGQYTVLNSPNEGVVARAVAELDYHAALLRRLDPEGGTITLHAGGAYGDKRAALERLLRNAASLSAEALARLTLENDDRVYDIDDVLWVCEALGVPAVFDLFHHRCHHRRPTPERELPDLLARAVETWGGRVPKLHLSSPREPGKTAHADYIDPADLDAALALAGEVGGSAPFDLMLEAKAKDLAVLRAAEQIQKNAPSAR